MPANVDDNDAHNDGDAAQEARRTDSPRQTSAATEEPATATTATAAEAEDAAAPSTDNSHSIKGESAQQQQQQQQQQQPATTAATTATSSAATTATSATAAAAATPAPPASTTDPEKSQADNADGDEAKADAAAPTAASTATETSVGHPNRAGVAHRVPLSRSPSEEGSEPEHAAADKPSQSIAQADVEEKDDDKKHESAKTRPPLLLPRLSSNAGAPQQVGSAVVGLPVRRGEGSRPGLVRGPAVRRLVRSRQGLTDEAFAAIAANEDMGNFLEVDVSRNALTSAAADSLLRLCAASPDLRILKLFNNQFGDSFGSCFEQLFRLCPRVEEVHMSHNNLTETGAEAVVRAAAACFSASSPSSSSDRPLWLRLEHNKLAVPSEDFAYQMKRSYPSICLRENSRACTNRACMYGKRIHLPFILDRPKGSGKGGPAPVAAPPPAPFVPEERSRLHLEERPRGFYEDRSSWRSTRDVRSRSRSLRGHRARAGGSRTKEARQHRSPGRRRHRRHERTSSRHERGRRRGELRTSKRTRETRKGRHRKRATSSSSSSSSTSSSSSSSSSPSPAGKKVKQTSRTTATTRSSAKLATRAKKSTDKIAAAEEAVELATPETSRKPPEDLEASVQPGIAAGKPSILRSREEVEADRRAAESLQRRERGQSLGSNDNDIDDGPNHTTTTHPGRLSGREGVGAASRKRRRDAGSAAPKEVAPVTATSSRKRTSTARSKAKPTAAPHKAPKTKGHKKEKPPPEQEEESPASDYTYSYYSYYAYGSDDNAAADNPKSSAPATGGKAAQSSSRQRRPAPSAAPGMSTRRLQASKKTARKR